jgi:hypothetical protein
MVREKIANQNDLTNVVFLDHIVWTVWFESIS